MSFPASAFPGACIKDVCAATQTETHFFLPRASVVTVSILSKLPPTATWPTDSHRSRIVPDTTGTPGAAQPLGHGAAVATAGH